MIYNFLPYMILPLYVALSKINGNVIAAARDLGANSWQTFTKVILPLSLPGAISGITMVFIPSLTTFFISGLLGGNKILLIGNIVEQEFTMAYDWHLGSGLSLVLMVFIIVNMVVTAYFDRSEGQVKKLYVALVVLFLYAPIGVLVAQSFNASRYRGHWTGFTLQWYGELFQNEGILDALQNTITIGLSSAAIATVLGLLTCMALRGMGRKQRSVYLGVASMPLLNADIVTGISLMLLFLGMGLRLGYGSILMAHVVFNLPYVILCIMPQFLSLDRSCYDAARDLGATPFVAFRRVVLPELRPSLLAGFMLAFTMSADDFIITHFTKGAGIDTLPTEIYAELKLGIHPEMYALSTLVFVFVLVFAVLLIVNRRRLALGRNW